MGVKREINLMASRRQKMARKIDALNYELAIPAVGYRFCDSWSGQQSVAVSCCIVPGWRINVITGSSEPTDEVLE